MVRSRKLYRPQVKEDSVPRYFTLYWKNQTLSERAKRREEAGAQGGFLHYAASNKFVERGIEPENLLYPVTVMDGTLYLRLRLPPLGRVITR